MITGSPTPTRLNTPIKSRRGDRARRPATNRRLRVCVESVSKVQRYLTGMVERSFDNAYGGTEKRMVLTVIDAVSNPKPTKRSGKRVHKGPQSLNHGEFWTAPCFATKVVRGKATTKAKAPRKRKNKGFSVHIGEDGCTNISVRSHLTKYGYAVSNKHTQPVPATEFSPGKVVNNNEFELANIRLEKYGRMFTATATVWNPESKVHKRIVVPRVRNKKEVLVALRTIHNVDC